MEDIIIVAILAVILGLVILYICREKKKGKKCIGCPYGCSCSSKNEGGCCSGSSCHTDN